MKLFFSLPVSINDGKYTSNINGGEVAHTFELNHEEADTRMVLHATLSSEGVVVAADTDVLLLYSKYMVKRRWVLRYENEKCADTETVSSCLGKYPVGIHLFKVNNRNTRTRCEICSKLTIKTPERRQWCLSSVFIVSFERRQ